MEKAEDSRRSKAKAPRRAAKGTGTALTPRVLAGTSGYSYKEWRGVFYPEQSQPDEWLELYGSRLPTVEINNTFYRMPRSHVVETWRDSVPEDFRFVIKASRRITHQKRLKDADEPVGILLKQTSLLGEKLGALLFQLPPQQRLNLDRLQSFQALLPEGIPAAFEFRHSSWNDESVDRALADRGHVRVLSHDGGAEVPAIERGPLCYLRLRASDYSAPELGEWRERVDGSGADVAFVFFKHEDAGGGPRMATEFLAAGRGNGGGRASATEASAAEPGDADGRKAPKRAGAKRASRRGGTSTVSGES
ncbi:MAG: DUF72 domain-containing protein [Pseudomonadota bacterium]